MHHLIISQVKNSRLAMINNLIYKCTQQFNYHTTCTKKILTTPSIAIGRGPCLQGQELNKPITHTKLTNTSEIREITDFIYNRVWLQHRSIDMCKMMDNSHRRGFKVFLYINTHKENYEEVYSYNQFPNQGNRVYFQKISWANPRVGTMKSWGGSKIILEQVNWSVEWPNRSQIIEGSQNCWVG